ncbi:MAG: carbon-nitrogen hydrolase family protein [Steroidobacteraceae bacterium]
MKVAAIQMCSGDDVARNLETAGRLLAGAAAEGAGLAVLPENFAFMGRTERDRMAVAEADGEGPIQSFLAESAAALGITLIGGTIPLRTASDPQRAAAASLVYGPDGQRVGRYDKIHLFDVDLPGGAGVYRESAGISPGRSPEVVTTPLGPTGVTVCYDLRFPELYRVLVARGAVLMVVSAAFTVPTGEAHWSVLLRARAIENLCAVVAAAQWGEHVNGRRTYGHSLVVDAWGRILAELAEGEGWAVAEIDLARQAALRTEFPALTHRVLA